VLVEVVRGDWVESQHRGSLVVLAADGAVVLALGQPAQAGWPRSSLKPLQAVGLLRAGWAGDDEQLALATASHSGTPAHVAIVRGILAAAGLTVGDLVTPVDRPLDRDSADALVREGVGPGSGWHNCSGKHAAMLATAVRLGRRTAGYTDPDHLVQQAVRSAVEDLTGEPVDAVTVDGCGAPLLAVSLTGLARGVQRLVEAAPGSAERRLADAARAHPWLVGGPGRDVTALMRSVPGLLAKDGAEGVYVAALPGVGAVALKIDDGSARARLPALLAALRALGVVVPPGAVPIEAVLGGGHRVGMVRAAPALDLR